MSRINLIKGIEKQFWEEWLKLFAPTLIQQKKWKKEYRNLKIGDVVLVLDPAFSDHKNRFKLAKVTDASPGRDGLVRKVTICYKSFRVGEKVHEYQGAPDIHIQRPIQKLVLLTPIDPVVYDH